MITQTNHGAKISLEKNNIIDKNEEERQRVLEIVRARHEFITDVDGYVYFWPSYNKGHISAHHLRWIADELDRLNKPWDDNINEYFENETRRQS